MGQFYEVQFAKRLDGADQHGNVTDSVKFTTEENSALWTHKPETQITQGMKAYGRIEQRTSAKGNTYYKFVREQQEDQGFTPQASTPQPSSGGYSKSSNNDGMRQGMCINNAVNLITASIQAGLYTDLTPEKFGEDVNLYARVLYAIDLSKDAVVTPTDEELEQGTLLDDIDQMFPTNTTTPGTDPR